VSLQCGNVVLRRENDVNHEVKPHCKNKVKARSIGIEPRHVHCTLCHKVPVRYVHIIDPEGKGMTVRLTRSQRRNRLRRRARSRRINQYLIDRQKEPMFPLAESLANELGDIAPGTPVTMPEFQRCLYRIAEIRAGKIKRSNRNERLGIG